MNIEDAMGICTSIRSFYKIEYQYLELVDWDIVPQIYGINYALQKIVNRADIELELVFTKLELKYAPVNHYEWLFNRINEINRSWDICPKPPGGLVPPEVVCTENENENGNGNILEYFTIRSLWDLKRFLDERKVYYDLELAWSMGYYLLELGNNFNKSGYEYDIIGYKTYVKTEIFYVQDIKRFIKIDSGIIG